MFPADLSIPMVAPADVGEAAATRLLSGIDDTGIRHVEGPARYSSRELAETASQVFGRRIELEVMKRENWKGTFLGFGFSEAAAEAYTRMTEICVEEGFDTPADAVKGSTTLETYIRDLAKRA